ncbi:MAG: hypothetical protein ACRDTD_18070 [Pseudonocardiaceae bacterium]
MELRAGQQLLTDLRDDPRGVAAGHAAVARRWRSSATPELACRGFSMLSRTPQPGHGALQLKPVARAVCWRPTSALASAPGRRCGGLPRRAV